jgi:very-short-patch-repair endonuclease
VERCFGNYFSNAKRLRENPTPAEELMWLSLRNNQLDGYKFRRQHPLLKYVADFTVTN